LKTAIVFEICFFKVELLFKKKACVLAIVFWVDFFFSLRKFLFSWKNVLNCSHLKKKMLRASENTVENL